MGTGEDGEDEEEAYRLDIKVPARGPGVSTSSASTGGSNNCGTQAGCDDQLENNGLPNGAGGRMGLQTNRANLIGTWLLRRP